MSKTIIPAPVKRSIEVKSARAKAFDVFANKTSSWWPKSHHIGKSPMAKSVIEPKAGGRWYEVGEDGTECQWGYVVAWNPPEGLTLAWQLNSQWQFDPKIVTEVEVKFTALGPSLTRVELEHRHLERFGDATTVETVRKSIDSDGGWPAILRAFASVADV